MSLASKLVAIHEHLRDARIEHAFGGAIALAYCTQEPRATIDLDINVFTGVDRVGEVFAAMPAGVKPTAQQHRKAAEDGQVRVMWGDTPLDIFFSYHAFHERVARRVRTVPFEGMRIPVLDCTDLVIFKALFGRTKDWADVEAAARTGSVDEIDATAVVDSLLGAAHESAQRLRASLERAGDEQDPRPLGRP